MRTVALKVDVILVEGSWAPFTKIVKSYLSGGRSCWRQWHDGEYQVNQTTVCQLVLINLELYSLPMSYHLRTRPAKDCVKTTDVWDCWPHQVVRHLHGPEQTDTLPGFSFKCVVRQGLEVSTCRARKDSEILRKQGR